MNIYLREIKAQSKGLLIWCISMAVFIALGMGKYAAMESVSGALGEFISSLPRSLQTILGGGVFDLNSAMGFYAVVFLYLVLIAAIHAATLGAGIISKEESDKTYEFLMVKPVSRSKIITSKIIAALTNIIILNIVTLITSISFVSYYENNIIMDILILMAGMFLLQLFFMTLGIMLAASLKNTKASVGIATGVLLCTYILSVAIDMNEKLDIIKYISPFQYFNAKTLLKGEGFNPLLVLITLGLSVLFILLSYMNYNKRDLG